VIRSLRAARGSLSGPVFDDWTDALVAAGEVDQALALAQEAIRSGYVTTYWRSVALARVPQEIRASPGYRELDALFRAEHAKLATKFAELTRG
jgi:hypothetical protein